MSIDLPFDPNKHIKKLVLNTQQTSTSPTNQATNQLSNANVLTAIVDNVSKTSPHSSSENQSDEPSLKSIYKVTLSISGEKVEVQSTLPLKRGQVLQVQWKSPSELAIRDLSPSKQAPEPIVQKSLKVALPYQHPLSTLLPKLTSQFEELTKTSIDSERSELKALIKVFLEKMPRPTDLDSGSKVKAWLNQSGFFLETQLHDVLHQSTALKPKLKELLIQQPSSDSPLQQTNPNESKNMTSSSITSKNLFSDSSLQTLFSEIKAQFSYKTSHQDQPVGDDRQGKLTIPLSNEESLNQTQSSSSQQTQALDDMKEALQLIMKTDTKGLLLLLLNQHLQLSQTSLLTNNQQNSDDVLLQLLFQSTPYGASLRYKHSEHSAVPLISQQSIPTVMSKLFAPHTNKRDDKMTSSSKLSSSQANNSANNLFKTLFPMLARIHSQQLNAITTASEHQSQQENHSLIDIFQIDIPVKNDDHFDNIELCIKKDDHTQSTNGVKTSIWQITLAFEFNGEKCLHAKLLLQDNQVEASFWTEKPSWHKELNANIRHFTHRLDQLGIRVSDCHIHQGTPKLIMNKIQTSSMIDVRT